MSNGKDLSKAARDLEILAKERWRSECFQRYVDEFSTIYPRGGRLISRNKHYSRTLEIADSAIPVRFNEEGDVVEVLCFIPHSGSKARWFNLETKVFNMNDLKGVPKDYHGFIARTSEPRKEQDYE
jgi:hypothetical protein